MQINKVYNKTFAKMYIECDDKLLYYGKLMNGEIYNYSVIHRHVRPNLMDSNTAY